MDQRDTQPEQPYSPPKYVPPPKPAPFYPAPQRTANKPTVRRRTAILGSGGGLVLGLVIGAAGHSNAKTSDTAAGTP